mgnify:CR=1 FL=1
MSDVQGTIVTVIEQLLERSDKTGVQVTLDSAIHGEGLGLDSLDRLGDINAISRGEQGLYRDDTRFLSFLELRLGAAAPRDLTSSVVAPAFCSASCSRVACV